MGERTNAGAGAGADSGADRKACGQLVELRWLATSTQSLIQEQEFHDEEDGAADADRSYTEGAVRLRGDVFLLWAGAIGLRLAWLQVMQHSTGWTGGEAAAADV